MKLPDGSILMHAGAPYDPVKAHEYYLKNRKLHPRQKGAVANKVGAGGSGVKDHTVQNRVRLSPEQYAKQAAYAAKRVADLRAKLGKLTAELHQRLAEARKREADAKKPQTAAEKAKAAREAKQYRQKHKQELSTKQKQERSKAGSASGSKSSSSSKTETVASLRQEIAVTKSNLKAAVAAQRAITAKQNG